MDGVWKTGTGGGAIRVDCGEGGAAKLVTVVEGGSKGRKLDAGRVDVGARGVRV